MKSKDCTEYFMSRFASCDTDSNLIVDYPDNEAENRYGSVSFRSQGKKSYERNRLLAAFAYALMKATAQKEAAFFSVPLVPHAVSADDSENVKDYLCRTGKEFDEDFAHSEALSADIMESLPFKSDVLIRFDEGDFTGAYNIMLTASSDSFSLSFRSSLYSSSSASRFLRLFISVLRGFEECEKLSSIRLQSDEDRKIVSSFNSTVRNQKKDLSVVSLFRNEAALHPDSTAIVCGRSRLTYSLADDYSDRIASSLAEMGVKNGDFVSILMKRSEWMTIASLGVLKAGAAYEPLDPSYPKERLSFMVEDAAPKAVIADRDLMDVIPSYKGPVIVTEEIKSLEKKAFTVTEDPSDPFILLYTSGTTGVPKGVILSRRNVLNYSLSYASLVNLTRQSRTAAYASFGFDANLMDTYPTLINGGEMHILAEDIRADLISLDEYFQVNRITHAFMTTQVGRQFALFTQSRSLKYLSLGGEKLTPFKPPKGLTVYNLYGPTECTVAVTAFRVVSDSRLLPIGRPLANTKLYVVDSSLRELPILQAGELCIAGEQVGKGYLNRDEKTKEVFISNPFTAEKGYEKLYRTGDIVRWLEDGNIEFIGRRDSLVKVRGFRIELTEVEKVIRDYEGIKDATVAAFDSPAGGAFIAAYVVSDGKIDCDALKAFIGRKKPQYMVPEVIMQIPAIPLTPNQKVNRRALPKPERTVSEYVSPRDDAEERIAYFVGKLIGEDRVSVTSDLFDCGLTSIGIIQLTAFMKREFNVLLQAASLRDNATVEALARLTGAVAKGAEKRKREVFYPVSSGQSAIFTQCLASPESTLYNIPFLFSLGDNVDLKRLEKAVIAAFNAHPYLKTILTLNSDGKIRAVRRDEALVSVTVMKTPSLPSRHKLVQSFSLTEKELYRIVFFITEKGRYLFLDIHHIIFDGSSFVILLEDIEKAYRGEKVEKEEYTAFDYALDEEEEMKGEKYREAKKYYRQIYSSLEETTSLPLSDVPKGGKSSFRKIVRHIDVPCLDIERWCHEHQTSETAFFNTAFAYVLSLFNGSRDVVYCTVYNGRGNPRLERSISMFVKTFPMYFCFDGTESVSSAVQKTGREYLDNMAHEIYPFAEIVKEFSLSADVLFSYQGDAFVFDSIAGEKSRVTSYERDNEKAEIVFLVTKENGKYVFTFSYNLNRYSDAFAASFVNSVEKAASSLISAEKMDEVECLSENERALIDGFNNTGRKHRKGLTVASLFRSCALKYPSRTAVVYKKSSLTYAELDSLSDRIASYLVAKGIGKGRTVSVLMSRSLLYPAATLGVIKSGAAYEPLDPDYPEERLSYMLSDASSAAVILDRKYEKLVASRCGVLLFSDEIGKLGSAAALPGISEDDPFILLYTSGTTGKPKGVVLTEKNIVNYSLWYRDRVRMNEESRIAAYASFGFDANMMDMYPTLITGSELHILPEEIRLDLQLIDRYFVKNRITHAFMTTQVGRQYALYTTSKDLKWLSMGGEKLTPLNPPGTLNVLNIYGPTETTVAVTAYIVKNDDPLLPIGKAVDNTKLYVVDQAMHILPPGAVGELCISGFQVGKGYLGKEEKTAEVFVPNPFTDEKGYEILYRTGDITRYLPDGNIDYVGRRDGLVKIRGFRVELKEIEKVIRDYRGIRDADVEAFDSPSGGKYLASYVTSSEKIDKKELDAFLLTKLPRYMVPPVMIQIDRIPLTVNQKVDRRALPKPEFSGNTYSAPISTVEEDFCSVFKNVLGLTQVSRDDDFFSIGGSSISAMKVVVEAVKKGYRIAYRDIFDYPTASKMAAHLSAGKKVRKESVEEKTEKNAVTDENGYDYSAISELLSHNTLSSFLSGKRNDIGDALVCGATGYLGIHILHELLTKKTSRVWAAVREKDGKDAGERMKELLSYYKMEDVIPLIGKRLFIIEEDLTGDNSLRSFRMPGITVFNALASVKHFGRDDEIETVNTSSVRNLISWALDNDSLLVHVSTESTAGFSVPGEEPFSFSERDFYRGQNITANKYVQSKFEAERLIYEAVISRGLRAKVMRVGNLSPRFSDGLFQINFSSNAFMKMLRAYLEIGKLPYSMIDEKVEFSPVDLTASAVILLSSAPDDCTVFMPSNHNLNSLGRVLSDIRQDMKWVEDDDFKASLDASLSDRGKSEAVSSLLTYSCSDGEEYKENGVETLDNSTTRQILYRMGFSWPVIDGEYIGKFVKWLKEAGFFCD